jgi:hypothetical protein
LLVHASTEPPRSKELNGALAFSPQKRLGRFVNFHVTLAFSPQRQASNCTASEGEITFGSFPYVLLEIVITELPEKGTPFGTFLVQ